MYHDQCLPSVQIPLVTIEAFYFWLGKSLGITKETMHEHLKVNVSNKYCVFYVLFEVFVVQNMTDRVKAKT